MVIGPLTEQELRSKMSLIIGYKKFVLKQRIHELEKAIRRSPEDGEVYTRRKLELDNLNKDLDGIIDEEK
jgi:hypothetical protein